MKKYIYKTNYEQTVVVKPTSKQAIMDNNGNVVQYITINPIKLKFPNCHCIVDEDFAKRFDLDIDTLHKMVTKNAEFGKKFWCIHEPTKELPKAKEAEIEAGVKDSRKKPKVVQGVRNR